MLDFSTSSMSIQPPSLQFNNHNVSLASAHHSLDCISQDDLPKERAPAIKTTLRQRTITHPYARLYAMNDSTKHTRKVWDHALEKLLFSSVELGTMGAPRRRTIYIASLEAHVERLHAQLVSIALYPISFYELDRYKGLNSKTAKSMVAGLQRDVFLFKLKLLELGKSNAELQEILAEHN